MTRFAVTVHVTQEVTVMVDSGTKEEAARAAEQVGLGFRNVIKAAAQTVAPASKQQIRRK